MVVKVKLETDIEPLKDLEGFISTMGDTAFEIAQDIWADIEPAILDELRFYPPVPPGSRYKRTLRLRRGWKATLSKDGNGFRIDVSNDTRYTQWVVGSLAKDRNAASRFQREFHKNNGWQLATDTVTFWFNAFNEDFAEAFNNRIGEFSSSTASRRAFTRIK